jgi:hypothetical protein
MTKGYNLIILAMHYEYSSINFRNVVDIGKIVLFKFYVCKQLILIFEKT